MFQTQSSFFWFDRSKSSESTIGCYPLQDSLLVQPYTALSAPAVFPGQNSQCQQRLNSVSTWPNLPVKNRHRARKLRLWSWHWTRVLGETLQIQRSGEEWKNGKYNQTTRRGARTIRMMSCCMWGSNGVCLFVYTRGPQSQSRCVLDPSQLV